MFTVYLTHIPFILLCLVTEYMSNTAMWNTMVRLLIMRCCYEATEPLFLVRLMLEIIAIRRWRYDNALSRRNYRDNDK